MMDFDPPPLPVQNHPTEAAAPIGPAPVSATRAGTRAVDPDRLAVLQTRAEEAIRTGDDAAARALVEEMLGFAENPQTPRARELAGILAERAGRFDEARAIFEAYLKDYPHSDAVPRVNMRLGALEKASGGTQEKEPRLGALSVGTGDVAAPVAAPAESRWRTSLRGNFSQFYLRDRSSARYREITDTFDPGFIDNRINVDQVLTRADVTAMATDGSTILEARASAGYAAEFRPVQLTGSNRNQGSYPLLDQLHASIADSGGGYRLTLGRQKEYRLGIFGRFDGISGSVRPAPGLSLRAAYGRPVWSERQTGIEETREFYAFGAEFGGQDKMWEAGLYWFDQRAAGEIDRQAIGAQVRMRGKDWSLDALADYDVKFGTLNAAFVNATKVWADGTSATVVGQHQHYPSLSLTNAVIGQLDPRLETILGSLDVDAARQIARDRTLLSRSVTGTVSKPLSDRWRLTVDAGVSSLSGDPGSLGIPAYLETGTEYHLGAQLHGNGVLVGGDTLITGARFADLQKSRIVSADVTWRLPLGPALYAAPRLRLSLRDHKENWGSATVVAPSVRAVWKVADGVEIDAQVGAVFGDERYINYDWSGERRETSFIAHVGYRIRF